MINKNKFKKRKQTKNYNKFLALKLFKKKSILASF